MKKLSLFALAAGTVLSASAAFAQSNQYTLPTTFGGGSNLPTATSIVVAVSRFDETQAVGQEFQPVTNGNLDFGTLDFLGVGLNGNPPPNIFVGAPSSRYFILDFGLNGGAGTYTATFNYTNNLIPAGATDGLGAHTVFNFSKTTGSGTTTTDNVFSTLAGNALTGVSINTGGAAFQNAAAAAGFLRTYYGIATDNSVAGASVITTANVPGSRTATLAITVTIP